MDTTTATDRMTARLRWARREASLAALASCAALLFVALAGSVTLTLFCALCCLLVEALNTRTREVIAETTLQLQSGPVPVA